MKFIFRERTEMTDDNLKLNDELQKLWDRGQIVECCLRMQAQYEKVVEQNRQLQAELKEKTVECEELKKEYEDILDSRQRKWEEENERYKQVLDEIEECLKEYDWSLLNCVYKEISDIISKSKENEND